MKPTLILLLFSLLVSLPNYAFWGQEQTKEIYVDRFYKTVDSILECKKPYNFTDTILFIQKALYSYRNNEVYNNFDSFLKCYEPKYENKLKRDNSLPEIEITSAYGRSDKKYILLFYIENYLLENTLKKNAVPEGINVYSKIKLTNTKTDKPISILMGEENYQKTLKNIYVKLITIFNDKKLLSELLYKKKISPLAYIGYKWEFDEF